MVRKRGILIACLGISFVLIALALFSFFNNSKSSDNISYLTGEAVLISEDDTGNSFLKNIFSTGNAVYEKDKDKKKDKDEDSYLRGRVPEDLLKEHKIEEVFLEEYKPKKINEEEVFLDKKFHDNGRYIISSLNEYSAEWYPDNGPKRDLKKLTIELQVTDKITGENFSIKGTADIPKYYSGHFDFNTSLDDLVKFNDINPDFTWEYSEEYSLVSKEKDKGITMDGDYIKSRTFVKEKEFRNYKSLDTKTKENIPKGLFLDPDVSACGTLSTAGAVYNLIQNVSSSSTCFTITGANIILNCSGYKVTYGTGGSAGQYGVYINTVTNVTVKNCLIVDGNFGATGWRPGIVDGSSNYSTLLNNYARTRGYGIWIGSSNNSNITNNIGLSTGGAGIYIENTRNTTFYGNNGTTLDCNRGFWMENSHYNKLINNKFVGADHATIFSNADYNNFTNNTAITINNSCEYGPCAFFFYNGADHNILINDTGIANAIENGGYSGAAFSFYDSPDNVASGINATALPLDGDAVAAYNANNILIRDCVKLSYDTTDGYAVEVSGTSTNFTAINCSYTLVDEYLESGTNTLTKKWYYRAYANYTNGTSVAGANITGRDSSSLIRFTENTSSSGWINRQELTEYTRTGSTRTYYNNYTISAGLTGHSTISRPNYNLTIKQNNVTDFFTFTGTTSSYAWVVNTTINNSLPDIGVKSSPEVFYKDSSWYMIAGEEDGIINGYVLAANGTTWLVNSTIVAGVPDLGQHFINPEVFYKDSSWYMIIANNSNSGAGREFFGYVWSGTQWVVNTTINASLDGYGDNSISVFYKDSSWYAICGDYNSGTWWGYTWSGGTWVANSTIEAGLPAIGLRSTPEVFQKDGIWYMISGNNDGEFKGFVWSGTQWTPNSTINASLPDIGDESTPTVFFKDQNWFLISGNYNGRFYGYVYNQEYDPLGGDTTPPTIIFESPTPSNTSSTSSPVTIVANISDVSNTSSWIDIDRTLLGYWAMDYYNTTGIFDNSTYRNNGTFDGGLATSDIITGKRGYGLEFNGVNQRIIIPNTNNLDFPVSGTVSLWVNVASNVGSYDMPLWRGGSSAGEEGYDYELGTGQWNSGVSDGVNYLVCSYSGSPLIGWNMLTFTFDTTTDLLTCYVNGTFTDDTNIAAMTGIDSSNNLYFGASGSSTSDFNGTLDEVLIFNRSLSAAEIKALYSSQINKFNTSAMNLSAGQHNYTVYAIDEYGNANNSGERNFIVAGGTGVSACQELGIANTVYILNNNVSSQGTCFNILNENITLDCNGYWINYSINGTNNQYGVVTNQFNTTVRNCNVVDGNWSTGTGTSRYGIYFNTADNGTLLNDYVDVNNSFSIYLYNGANFNNLTSNRGISNSNSAIYIDISSNSNKLINNNGTSNKYFGIYLGTSSSNNNLISNIGTSFGSGVGTANGIVLSSAPNNTLTSNTGISNTSYGIYLSSSSGNNLTSNKGTSNSSRGIYLVSSLRNNLTFNNGTSFGNSYGIYLYLSNETIMIGNTGTSTSSTGLRINTASNNTLINTTAISGSSSAVLIYSSSDIIFRDCANISGGTYDVYYDGTGPEIFNITFINCSYDSESVSSGDELIRKWYYQAYVNDSVGSAVSDANITAYNTSSVIHFTEQTNSSGWIQRKEVIEYINTGGTRVFWNNYTISASKTGYITDNNIWNFTTQHNKINDFFTLTSTGGGDTTPPTITFESPTPSNTSSTTSPVTIVANISDESNTSSFMDFDRTLRGYWSMDYYNSTGIRDNSTYNMFGGFNGGLSTSDIETGKRGNALKFDSATSDYLSIGTYTLSELTFAMWVKRGTITTWSTLIGANGGSGYEFNFDGDASGTINAYTANQLKSTTSLAVGQWYHVALVTNSTGSFIFVNGVKENQNTYTTGITATSLALGRWSTSQYLNATLDEVMIFNRSLSGTEIKALYSSQINKFNSSPMSLSTGTHTYDVYAIDESGNAATSGLRNFLVQASSTVSSCQTLSSANTYYTLTTNISSTGTCITLNAENITLDCNGYRITYTTDGGNGEYGVDANYNGATIKNCHILDGNSADDQWTPGILLDNAINNSIVNNTLINHDSIGVWIASGYNNNISNNILVGPEAPIYIEGGGNNNVINNNLTSPTEYALILEYYGVPSSYNTFIGNTIYSGTDYAVLMSGVTYNTFINNTIISASTSANSAIYFYDDTISSDYNTFINNTIRGYRGVYFSNAEYNNFVGNNITATYNGINLDASSNNLFRDCVSMSGVTYDFYTQNTATNNTFINCSFTLSKGVVNSGGSITNKWYYRAYANYSNSTPAAGVNITINNSAGLVGAGGWSDELVDNGGFEDGDVSGWTTSGAYWGASGDITGNNTPANGSYFAYTSNGADSSSYIYQNVDISAYASQIDAGTARVNASGWAESGELPPQDWVRVQIMYLFLNGTQIGTAEIDTGNIGVFPWKRYGIFNDVPPVGARYVRVWGNTYEVGYSSGALDDFSVKVYTPPAPLVTDGTGWIDRQEVTEYTNSAGSRTYYNNYSINATLNSSSIVHIFNFTIQQNKVNDFFTFNVSGTCTYSSGNWNIDCSEGCIINNNYDVGGNNITIVGYGTITVTGNITNYNVLHIEGEDSVNICTVRCVNGGCFKG